jgi:hypothetical protein
MYTYTSFQLALAIEMAVPNNNPADPQFVAILPTLIDQAEQRCYRDLNLLYATSSQTIALTAGSSRLDFSTLMPKLLILEDINLVLPATQTNPEFGERVPLYPVTTEWIRMVFGLSSTQGPPQYYALHDDHTVVLGPFPDQGYTAELKGKFRPTPLYLAAPADGTQTTILTSILPDLFLAAAMCAASGYQHNWSSMADDPRQAQSWEGNYQTLLTSAREEETRKKIHGWMGLTAERAPPPTPPGTPGPT